MFYNTWNTVLFSKLLLTKQSNRRKLLAMERIKWHNEENVLKNIQKYLRNYVCQLYVFLFVMCVLCMFILYYVYCYLRICTLLDKVNTYIQWKNKHICYGYLCVFKFVFPLYVRSVKWGEGILIYFKHRGVLRTQTSI